METRDVLTALFLDETKMTLLWGEKKEINTIAV